MKLFLLVNWYVTSKNSTTFATLSLKFSDDNSNIIKQDLENSFTAVKKLMYI